MAISLESIDEILTSFFAPERRAWRGEAPLGVVFWGYGVFASLFLMAIIAAALHLEKWWLLQLLILLSFFYTAWILVAIWRCAKKADLFWGTLAQWLTIAWAFNAAFVLIFLEFNLLEPYVAR